MNIKFMKSYAAFRLGAFVPKVVNVMASRNRGRSLINGIKSILVLSGLSYSPGRIRAIVAITRRIAFLTRHNGVRGVTLYLKGCSVMLQQAIGLHVVPNSKAFGPAIGRAGGGLPVIIPAEHRRMIRGGNTKWIRFYLSVFHLYRLFEWIGPIKLETITQPCTGTGLIDLSPYIKPFVTALPMDVRTFRMTLESFYKDFKLINLFKSGPNTEEIHNINSGPVTVAGSARMIYDSPALLRSMRYFLMKVPIRIRQAFTWLGSNIPNHVGMHAHEWYQLQGKLGLQPEPAGKIRVYAMVDAWTQWVLNPLHNTIFRLLRLISQDGTFDQLAPIHRLLKVRGLRLKSLDLSAATDRLPVVLQRQLLAALLGTDFANSWVNLLVMRDYYGYHKDILPKSVSLRYSVGQPMGALSSWAMLALTHHFIIQAAAWRCGIVPRGTWYSNYAVLGDDVVIGDDRVAVAYLEILSSLGVECGLHKSLLASRPGTLEFAKRTFYKGVDVSPIPFKELRAASLSLGACVEFMTKYQLSLAQLLKAFGYGYRVLGSLTAPLGTLNANIRAIQLVLASPKSASEVSSFLMLGAPKRALPRVRRPTFDGDPHSFYAKGGPAYTGADLNKLFIELQVKPCLAVLTSLISELREKVSPRIVVKAHVDELLGYYAGGGEAPPNPRTLFDHLLVIWSGTTTSSAQDVRVTIMKLRRDLEFIIKNPAFFTFEEMYWDLYLIKKEIANMPLVVVRAVRDMNPEVLATTPYHVRS